MIAGTGTSVYLLKDNTYTKTSGWGPVLGDEGSGYDIGNRAIRFVARMADGRMTMDETFYHSILSHFFIDPQTTDALVDVATGSAYTKQVASASRVVMNLYEAGNPLAKELINYAAEELTLAVSALLCKVPGQKFTLLLSGGLLENDTPLRRVFLQRIHNNPQITSVQAPQVKSVQAAASLALLFGGHREAAELLLQK
jgi:N-acetylglucosamine kinase-like BadF-type ATPase